jgi:hypothetical protein
MSGISTVAECVVGFTMKNRPDQVVGLAIKWAALNETQVDHRFLSLSTSVFLALCCALQDGFPC